MSNDERPSVSAGQDQYTVSYSDSDGGQTRILRPGTPHTIGRSDACDIVVKHGTVSRNHAVLVGSSPPTIKDLGSRNGTRVSSRRIPAGTFVPIEVGTPVQVGDVVLFVQRTVEEPVDTMAPETADEQTAHSRAMPQRPSEPPADELVVRSARTAALIEMARVVAKSDLSVLVLGETGVGKERLAQTIHAASPRASYPLVTLNCAAFPESMIESELFGYERGAFTGAARAKRGLIAAAERGTLFLDEVGELTLPVQAKLLRVLEARELLPLGALKPISVDVRVVAATNVDLHAAIAAGRFREDLYYRLNGVSLTVPPLRERREDIVALAERFSTRFAAQLGRPRPLFTEDATAAMLAYSWPGNVRELKNVVERATLLAPSGIIEAAAVPGVARLADDLVESEREVGTGVAATTLPGDPTGAVPQPFVPGRRRLVTPGEIMVALANARGDQAEAAKLLGISRRTLINYLDKFDLPRPRKRPG